MAAENFSLFLYGMEITQDNQNLNFDEGSGELTAVIEIGPHTLSEMASKIKTAMDAAGTQSYTITLDRASRKFTISAASGFSLLVSSGSQVGTSPWSIIGFTGADKPTATSHVSNGEAASIYKPQFKLQDYTPSTNFKEKVDPNVHESANGEIETVFFGDRSFIEMSIKFITDKPQDNMVIKSNPTGVADARAFFQEMIRKVPFEFVEDIDAPTVFERVLAESLPGNSRATGYRMREMVGDGLPGYFEMNNIKLRVVT